MPPLANWFGDLVSHPAVVTHAHNVNDLRTILQSPERFPAPVRAVGSNHSTTRCGTADGGTVIVMRAMNRILHVGADTVTAEAGALYIDVARELRKHGLQFYVNVELGNLTIGSAACGGTKDASMPGEFGQVCSYATVIKLVTPSGELLEVTEDQPELLQVMRSSYGLLGIIYEVTFKVRPLRPLAVRHATYTFDEFARQFPALRAQGESLMFYLFPFGDTVTVEFRKYQRQGRPTTAWPWQLRNFVWKTLAPLVGRLASRGIPVKPFRYFLIDNFNRLLQFVLTWLIRSRHTAAPDQQIRYPTRAGLCRYTFSFWAFPEDAYLSALRDYFALCREYYRNFGYRCDILNVGYRIEKDTGSLFSYSFHGAMITFDPVATGGPGWVEFLTAYNDLCSRHGGVPLFNQTWGITRPQVEKAFGERLRLFWDYQQRFDPTGRLLNPYFRELLGPAAEIAAVPRAGAG